MAGAAEDIAPPPGLSLFVNNPYRRKAEEVVELLSPAPAKEKKKKRPSSDVSVKDRLVDGDAARKYRKLEEVAEINLNAAIEEGECVTDLKEGKTGRRKKRPRKVDEVIAEAENRGREFVGDGKNVLEKEGDLLDVGGGKKKKVEKEEAKVRKNRPRSKGAGNGEEKEMEVENVGCLVEEDEGGGKRKRGEDEKKVIRRKPNAEEEEERFQRTIFVGNLPTAVKKKALIKEFSQFGAVETARLRCVPLVDTKLPRKAAVITGKWNEERSSLNAYVVYKSRESAQAALAHNMKEFESRHLRVDMAGGAKKDGIKASVDYDKTRSIFVGNLPFDVEDEELIKLFAGPEGAESQLEGVRVVRDRQTSIGKGFAFVLFKSKEAASQALRRSVSLRDRKLRVYRLSHGHAQTQQQKHHQERRHTGFKRHGEMNSFQGDEPPRKKARGPLPYEGLRASKLGKGMPKVQSRPSPSKRPSSNLPEPKKKRPAVAARKAASTNKDYAGGQQKSLKRKREDRRPARLIKEASATGRKRNRDDGRTSTRKKH